MQPTAKNEPTSPPPYPETADIETSSDGYANRFAGPAGEWMLSVQEHGTLRLLHGCPTGSVLDVGGGHGQLTRPLCREGIPVHVLGSDPSCAHRISDLIEQEQCAFTVGNVIDLPFPDRSFDTVISFRLVTHCSQWPKLIAELCRVARHSVIVDYPTSQSLNAIAPLLFGAKKKLEGDTRTWTLFRHHQIDAAFAAGNFSRTQRFAQFFLPMVLHRAVQSRSLSAALEALPRLLGLTRLWGSPIIARYDRDE
ncbi:MAG: class I SAM-dependent methyltransferase [Verrucomicrobia bacterium]|nr:class I SAM-dependent methyltransferase [Verrucomicrobiota bacterium]